jgi:hypothetical protein
MSAFREFLNEGKDESNYNMLGRLQQDNEYFLGNGNGDEKHLWALNVKDQIAEMKKLWNGLKEKPEWLTMKQIKQYEKEMLKLQSKSK